MRKARHLLQHTVNSLHSTMEISDQQVKCARELHHIAKCNRQLIGQAALTCLGHIADQSSHKTWNVYIGAALKV
jgi:hypothetical protein